MDFKERYPDYSIWPVNLVKQGRVVSPYGSLMHCSLFEMFAEDGTRFITTCGDFSPAGEKHFYYALEVSKTSKFLHEWEAGRLSWAEFWSHKGWLLKIEATMFDTSDGKTEYTTFEDLSECTKSKMTHYKNTSPFICYLNQLECGIECCTSASIKHNDRRLAELATDTRLEYENFLKLYSHMIEWKKVA
jgi:hypothetical protein